MTKSKVGSIQVSWVEMDWKSGQCNVTVYPLKWFVRLELPASPEGNNRKIMNNGGKSRGVACVNMYRLMYVNICLLLSFNGYDRHWSWNTPDLYKRLTRWWKFSSQSCVLFLDQIRLSVCSKIVPPRDVCPITRRMTRCTHVSYRNPYFVTVKAEISPFYSKMQWNIDCTVIYCSRTNNNKQITATICLY